MASTDAAPSNIEPRDRLTSADRGSNLVARGFARDFEAGSFLQWFLVCGVVSVLVTRLYLQLTGFPRIGGGELHFAHLLWGGLLMLIALILLLTVLGKRAKRLAATLGGIGFGLFVDELGKFVTADNDYFFQPTIALIYMVFVCLFLAGRAIERRSWSRGELLVNAADMLREIVLGGATRGEVVRARRLLDRSGADGPIAQGLRASLAGAQLTPEHTSVFVRWAEHAWRLYDHLLEWRWFQRGIIVVFVLQAVLGVITTVVAAATMLRTGTLLLENGAVVTSSVSLALVLVGAFRLPVSRLGAYRWFERAVLVSIFFTQVILFWQDQLAALGGLVWAVVLLAALRFLIRQEETRVILRNDTERNRSSRNL